MTRDERGWTDGDERMLTAAATGHGVRVATPEELHEVGERAAATKKHFDESFAAMTTDEALFVRRLRVDDEYTWRAVAGTCALEWRGEWGQNQLAGMAICERAAGLLGEHYMEEPWN
jgi:hypothetical protein